MFDIWFDSCQGSMFVSMVLMKLPGLNIDKHCVESNVHVELPTWRSTLFFNFTKVMRWDTRLLVPLLLVENFDPTPNNFPLLVGSTLNMLSIHAVFSTDTSQRYLHKDKEGCWYWHTNCCRFFSSKKITAIIYIFVPTCRSKPSSIYNLPIYHWIKYYTSGTFRKSWYTMYCTTIYS